MVGAMPVNLIPIFYNGSMDSHNGIENDEIQVHIGSRIKCGDDFGTVKYIGEIQGYKGVWYGVEWDDAARGKHDGVVEGVQYFRTSKPGSGSFVRPNKISPMRTCADAIRQYYGDREDETVAAHRRTVINEWKREMGAPFIEMVGFEKIHQKQKLDRLQEVCVHDQSVSTAGDVSALCPNIRSLDLSANLFANWREVISLSQQLPRLADLDLRYTDLDLSKNRMAIDMSTDTLREYGTNFDSLEKLNLSVCDLDWTDIVTLSHLFPNLKELIVAHNRVSKICHPPATLASLSVLRLDGCPVDDWGQVVHLGWMKSLKVLSLNDCQLQEIRFPEGDCSDLFRTLEVLFLNRNRIHDWRSLSELDKIPHLKKLYFLKNPVQMSEDYDTGSQMIIAKIGSLQELNGSIITPEHRRGAEYDYMKRYGAEWKLSRLDPAAARAFDLEHCRFQLLINKYGVPDDSLLVKQPKNTTLTSQLLEITLSDETGNTVQKKFPSTMAVQKLVTLAQRIFSKFGHKGKPSLFLLDEQMKGREIHLDNNMKDLTYFSVKNGDVILVRFR